MRLASSFLARLWLRMVRGHRHALLVPWQFAERCLIADMLSDFCWMT